MATGIEGKIIVITGASSGLSKAAARRLVADSARLVLGARRLGRLEALAAELSLENRAIVQTDVADRGQVQRLIDQAAALHGGVDVLLNNAGPMPSSRLELLKVDEWDRMIDTNIKGVLHGVAAVQKQTLADAITAAVREHLGYGEDAVSVSMEEIAPAEWDEKVYQPDIVNGPGKLCKAPGYGNLRHTRS
jgi:NADP-dependent 3-hydroxy acid dehydrogenase YdfG